MAMPNCFRLLRHWLRRAASRAAWTAGSSRAMSVAMIAITTSNSIKVKPERLVRSDATRLIIGLLKPGTERKEHDDAETFEHCGKLQCREIQLCVRTTDVRPNLRLQRRLIK